MPQRTVVVASRIGLHARPASLVSLAAARLDAPVVLAVRGREADAASILGVLALGVAEGEEVTVISDDPDAVEAISELLARDLTLD